jgi:hypothetical protein
MFLEEFPNVTTEFNSAYSLPLVAQSNTPVEFAAIAKLRECGVCP